ncbi:MAG: glycosyltransferase family 39 protein [Kiritimatiellae bacterium]|nr:glycosyltransferase family 39 protein [Kiritimatiellia bacterium]
MNKPGTDTQYPRGLPPFPVVLAAAFLLRMVLAWKLPLLGDEVGTWIYMGRDARTLLTEFREPWLSMGPYILLCKIIGAVFGEHPLILRLPVLLAGVATLPYLAGIVRRLGGGELAARLVVILGAFHPYLVSQSVNLRSYALLIFCTAGGLYYLLRWLEQRTWSSGFLCGALCGLGWLSHFNMVYALAALGAIGAWGACTPWSHVRMSSRLWDIRSIVVPVILFLLPAALYHAQVWSDMVHFRQAWSGPAPSTVDYLPEWARSFFGSGWWVYPSLFLTLGGWIHAVRHSPRVAIILALGVVVPMVLYAATGAQHYPWGSTRLLVVVLPFLLIQMALALSALRQFPHALWGGLCLVLASWAPGLEAKWKDATQFPWRDVQSYLATVVGDQQRILAPGHGQLHLMPGFRETPWKLMAVNDYLAEAEAAKQVASVLFLVTTQRLDGRTEPHKEFGEVFIYRYEGDSRREIAVDIVRDIQQTLHGEANPNRVALAQSALDLMMALAWNPAETLEMQQLYFHSLLQSSRGRFMPIAQREKLFP